MVAGISAGMVILLNNGDSTFGKPTNYGPRSGGMCRAGPIQCAVAAILIQNFGKVAIMINTQ